MRWLLTYPEDGPSVAFYDAWVRAAGAEPVLVSPDYAWPESISSFAALLLPGGGDVEPALYGDVTRHARTAGILPHRDTLECHLIREFLSLGRPVFGICRGLQILAVATGGALHQHVPDLVDPSTERHGKKDAYDATHGVTWTAGTRMGSVLSEATEVNSAHHQAVRPESLAAGLVVTARSPNGIVEAVEGSILGGFVSAVQWHPERLPEGHPASRLLRLDWAAIARRD